LITTSGPTHRSGIASSYIQLQQRRPYLERLAAGFDLCAITDCI